MRRIFWLFVFALIVPGLAAVAQEGQEPQDVDLEERVRVNLVIVDTVVLDGQGRTVGGLTRDDFLLSVQGRAQEIDTFDELCTQPGLPEPSEVTGDQERERFSDQSERRLVLAFDYVNTSHQNRTASLRSAQQIVARDMAPGDGIMIVALTDRLRIEQRFSGSPKMAFQTLQRMEHDASLFGRTFGSITPRGFLDTLGVLADVLSQYPGPKAVVLFSEWGARADEWDTFFIEAAQRSAAARTALYPVWAAGLHAGGRMGGSPSLARLANESGGRFTRNTNDLSMAFVLARRDLTCRYAIGFYADPEASRRGRTVNVRLKEGSYRTRAPERIRLWSEQERQASMLRAAFANPGPNDDPLVRAFALPFRPMSRNNWETLLALSFPLHVDEQGASRSIGVALDRDNLNIETMSEMFEFPPRADGKPGVRPVALYGQRRVRPGPHTLTIAISRPGTDEIKTTRLEFTVPEVPQGQLIVSGPLLARVDPNGVRIRVEGGKKVEDPELDALIGDAGAVPLVVAQVAPDDTLLAAWDICAVGTGAPSDAVVERRIRSEGEIVHRLDSIPLDLQGGRRMACQSGMDKLPGGTLGEGRYRFEVAVVDGKKDLTMGLRPFALNAGQASVSTNDSRP